MTEVITEQKRRTYQIHIDWIREKLIMKLNPSVYNLMIVMRVVIQHHLFASWYSGIKNGGIMGC